MAIAQSDADRMGEFQSPGGFVFGVQGWNWGEQHPTSITFFLDGTAKVSDQHGRAIPGVVKDGRPIYFGKCPHAQTVALLAEERVDWQSLACAGWPQLPYAQLREMRTVPPTLIVDLKKIKDAGLRKDALRFRREVDAAAAQEARASEQEDEPAKEEEKKEEILKQ